jgi:23S rRNA pseudouridine1911/1915/1917 synthase
MMKIELESRILYCDDNCIVVNKIPGEAVEGAGKGMADLPKELGPLISGLKPGALALPVAAHRLDVPVSGCALFARKQAALVFLNNAFRNNIVQKKYWAITQPPDNAGQEKIIALQNSEIVHWLQFVPRQNKSIAHNEQGPGRKKAVLRYRLIGNGQNYWFLEIELATGRHHQIRAQLERLGLHIKGDLKYGARRSEQNGGIRLHAHSLSFPNPAGNSKPITVKADPPLRDNLWQAFLDALIP